MANTSSAKKAIRQIERRTVKNLRRSREFKAARKQVLKAVAAGDEKDANTQLTNFHKQVDKAAKHNGPLHKKTAARYKSRLAATVNKAFSE